MIDVQGHRFLQTLSVPGNGFCKLDCTGFCNLDRGIYGTVPFFVQVLVKGPIVRVLVPGFAICQAAGDRVLQLSLDYTYEIGSVYNRYRTEVSSDRLPGSTRAARPGGRRRADAGQTLPCLPGLGRPRADPLQAGQGRPWADRTADRGLVPGEDCCIPVSR